MGEIGGKEAIEFLCKNCQPWFAQFFATFVFRLLYDSSVVCQTIKRTNYFWTTTQKLNHVFHRSSLYPCLSRLSYRRINLEFHLMAPGKNRKQRSDCFFLLYTITTNISETFTNLWHRESIKIMVWKTGVRTFKIGKNREKYGFHFLM